MIAGRAAVAQHRRQVSLGDAQPGSGTDPLARLERNVEVALRERPTSSLPRPGCRGSAPPVRCRSPGSRRPRAARRGRDARRPDRLGPGRAGGWPSLRAGSWRRATAHRTPVQRSPRLPARRTPGPLLPADRAGLPSRRGRNARPCRWDTVQPSRGSGPGSPRPGLVPAAAGTAAGRTRPPRSSSAPARRARVPSESAPRRVPVPRPARRTPRGTRPRSSPASAV